MLAIDRFDVHYQIKVFVEKYMHIKTNVNVSLTFRSFTILQSSSMSLLQN